MSVTTHTTYVEVWAALAGMFAFHTHVQSVNIALATMKKDNCTKLISAPR
jgi:hypothetical protein